MNFNRKPKHKGAKEMGNWKDTHIGRSTCFEGLGAEHPKYKAFLRLQDKGRAIGTAYRILTYGEMEELYKDLFVSNLFHTSAERIVSHSTLLSECGNGEEVVRVIQQGAGNVNPLLASLIDDLDEFREDTRKELGFASLISVDGKVWIEKVDGIEYYICVF